jgi:hypothetical protein
MSKVLLVVLGIGVNVKFMLYQFPRNSRHVDRLPCEDVPIFLEEFDEREFLFRIQIIPHMSDLGGLIRGEWNGLAELVPKLDGQLGGLGLRHDWVRGTRPRPSSDLGVVRTPITCPPSRNSHSHSHMLALHLL